MVATAKEHALELAVNHALRVPPKTRSSVPFLSRYRQPVLYLEVTVDAIQKKPAASSYFSFQVATREAIEEALGGVRSNFVWR